MANKAIFASTRGATVPVATTTNEAGGLAYARTPKNALAQLAATGTLGDAFYADARTQLTEVLQYLNHPDMTPEYAAKVAVYASERAYMKDMPALICAWLRNQGPEGIAVLDRIFPRVITNGRMLRNFVQILRSGQTGKHKSIKGAAKRLVNTWLKNRKDWALFKDSVGNDPSLADIVKMSRPKAGKSERAALYGYLIGKVKADDERLPDFIRQYEAFKVDSKNIPVPNVEFRMLSGMDLTKEQWAEIAKRGAFHQTRMNLNNYARHGVFKVKGMVEEIAAKLRDPESIKKAKVFPYQLMSAYLATTGALESQYSGYFGYSGVESKPKGDVPTEITEALQDALEASTANVPAFDGTVLVGVDVSGSMRSPVTGQRGAGQTTSVMCVDVAALFASIIMRQNKSADVLGFHTQVEKTGLNPRDTVITNAKKLRNMPSGGTDCSVALRDWNQRKVKGDLVVIISDSESWRDTIGGGRTRYGGGTGLMGEWESFRARNPKAKLVCIDLQPYTTAQALDRDDILLVGGFSDSVFDIVRLFAEGRLSAENWVSEIEKTEL